MKYIKLFEEYDILNNEEKLLDVIADMVRRGILKSSDPEFEVSYNLDEDDVELGDVDYEHMSDKIREGYKSGELNVGEDEVRGWWHIDMQDIPRATLEYFEKLIKKIVDPKFVDFCEYVMTKYDDMGYKTKLLMELKKRNDFSMDENDFSDDLVFYDNGYEWPTFAKVSEFDEEDIWDMFLTDGIFVHFCVGLEESEDNDMEDLNAKVMELYKTIKNKYIILPNPEDQRVYKYISTFDVDDKVYDASVIEFRIRMR